MNDIDALAAAAEADRAHPLKPEPSSPAVRAEMLADRLAWLRRWAVATGADVRREVEYWKEFYCE